MVRKISDVYSVVSVGCKFSSCAYLRRDQHVVAIEACVFVASCQLLRNIVVVFVPVFERMAF